VEICYVQVFFLPLLIEPCEQSHVKVVECFKEVFGLHHYFIDLFFSQAIHARLSQIEASHHEGKILSGVHREQEHFLHELRVVIYEVQNVERPQHPSCPKISLNVLIVLETYELPLRLVGSYSSCASLHFKAGSIQGRALTRKICSQEPIYREHNLEVGRIILVIGNLGYG